MTAPIKKPLSKEELLKIHTEATEKLIGNLSVADLIKVMESTHVLYQAILGIMHEGNEATKKATSQLAQEISKTTGNPAPQSYMTMTANGGGGGDPLAGTHAGLAAPLLGQQSNNTVRQNPPLGGNRMMTSTTQGSQSGNTLQLDTPYLEAYDGLTPDDTDGLWSPVPMEGGNNLGGGVSGGGEEWNNEEIEAERQALKEKIKNSSLAFSPTQDAPTGE